MHPLLVQLLQVRRRSAPWRLAGALLLPFRALRFLKGQRRLWPLVVVPALINMVLFIAALALLFSRADDVLGAWWAKPEGAAGMEWLLLGLWYVAWLLALVLGIVLAYVAVLLVGGIVGSPFNDALSERTETVLTGREKVPAPGTSFWSGVFTSIGSSVAITVLYGMLMVPVLFLNLVPGIGSLGATVIGSMLGAFFITLEYADAVFERYGLRWREKIGLLRGNKALALGFGLGTGFLLWIPLLNVLCIPVAVIGGTTLALGLVMEEG